MSISSVFSNVCRSSHLLSLCNFLIRNYQSSISIVLRLRPLILNHSLFSLMTSVLLSPPLQCALSATMCTVHFGQLAWRRCSEMSRILRDFHTQLFCLTGMQAASPSVSGSIGSWFVTSFFSSSSLHPFGFITVCDFDSSTTVPPGPAYV